MYQKKQEKDIRCPFEYSLTSKNTMTQCQKYDCRRRGGKNAYLHRGKEIYPRAGTAAVFIGALGLRQLSQEAVQGADALLHRAYGVDGDKLGGLIRVPGDSETLTQIHYMLVHPNYQRQGIAGKMLELIKEKYKDYLYIESMNVGISYIFLLVGFRAVPQDLIESAYLDGAGVWARIWHVMLPMASPQIFFVLFLNIAISFRSFAQIKLLTGGGPANATKNLIYYIYENAIINGRYETACVQAIFLFGLILLFTSLQFALEKRFVHYQ